MPAMLGRGRFALMALLTPMMLAACSLSSGADDDLLVFAAASLTDAMGEIAAAYEAETGAAVAISYGPSQALAQQIASGANPDIYIAAGISPMTFLEDEGHVAVDKQVHLLTNTIVVAVPQEVPNISALRQLAASDLKRIAMPDPAIAPAGDYARRSLQNLDLWDALQPRLVYGNDVRAALAYVQTGSADAAFVYRTDAKIAPNLRALDIVPADSYPAVIYPAVVVRATDDEDKAQAFLDFLQTQAAAQVFRKHGFTPLPAN